ncbi:hypothetical protein MNBD_ALPHA04-702 [hydrothermal vent metagenome]|uniref:Uncharacterized protein n=1 Tax=hydrothermal vent metagenome TaxID=652676 RepID=A0A3B0RW23_9ZZZZ
MRKLIVAISVMALPLAACDKQDPAPPEPEPTQQVIEEPTTPPEIDPAVPDTEAASEGETGNQTAKE